MIATWMIYSSVVGIALFAAAMASDVLGRAIAVPTRTLWSGALAATLALSARGIVAAHRPQSVDVPTIPRASFAVANGSDIPVGATARVDRNAGTDVRDIAPASLSMDALRAAIPRLATASARLDEPLAVVAMALALLGLGRIARSLTRLAHLARTLPSEVHDGRRVLVSEDVGPALLGVFHPRIVVPRWWLALGAADRRMILAHEEQHADAGDQILLIAGAVAVALQPWNVGLWLSFARLRLAIEVDCDARVLRSGAEAKQYGTLLLAVHERAVTPRRRELAFFASPSSLRKRILRMTRPAPKLRSALGAASIVMLGAAITVASSTPLPAAPTRRSVVASSNVARDTMPSISLQRRIDSNRLFAAGFPGLSAPQARETVFVQSTKKILRDTTMHALPTSPIRPDSIEWEWIPKGFPLPPNSHRVALRKMFAMGPGPRFDVVLSRLQQQKFFAVTPEQFVAACGDVGSTVGRWSIRVHENDAWRVWLVPDDCRPSDPALLDQVQGLRTMARDLFRGLIPNN